MRIGMYCLLLGAFITTDVRPQSTPTAAWQQDLQLCSKQVSMRKPDAADVALRRTLALLKHLQGMRDSDNTRLDPLAQNLKLVERECRETPVVKTAARKTLYAKLCQLRPQVAFANPLLHFERIALIKRHRALYNHMVLSFESGGYTKTVAVVASWWGYLSSYNEVSKSYSTCTRYLISPCPT